MTVANHTEAEDAGVLDRVEPDEFTASWAASPRMAWLDRLIGAAMTVLLVVAVGLVMWVMIARALFDIGTPWALEGTKFLVAGIVFLGSAVAFHRGEHRSLRLVIERFPKPVVEVIDAFNLWLIAAFAVVFGYGGFHWMQGAEGYVLGTSERIPFWVTTIPVTVGAAVLAIYAVGLVLEKSLKSNALSLLAVAGFGALCWWLGAAFPGTEWLTSAFSAYMVVFAVLLILGMPVGFCFAVCTIGLVYGLDGVVPLEGIARRYSEAGSSFILTAVPFFVAAGLLMESGDITRRIIAAASSFLGHIRGHVGHVTIGSMYFMSGVSGSEAADVAAVGTVMRKPMRQAGFSGGESTGIILASQVMGASVPPSIALIVVASSAGLSVGTLFLAGFLPAAVLMIVLFVTVYVRARMLGMAPGRKSTWRERGRTVVSSLPAIGLPLIILVGLTTGLGTPTELSAAALVYALFIEAVVHRAITWSDLRRVAVETGVITGMLLFILAAASALVHLGTFASIPQRAGTFLTDLSGANASIFLVLTIVALIPIGMLMEGIAALLVFPPLLVPAAVALGIDPIHYAILIMIAVLIGANLPPIGAGFYFGTAVMKCSVSKAIGPSFAYLGIVALGVIGIAFVPQVSLLVPDLLGMS